MYALGPETMAQLTSLRVNGWDPLRDYAAERPRRSELTVDGKLVILAADHPARMVTSVGDDPLRMGLRAEYLGRIARVLESGFVDGLMGTPDILEEIMALDALRLESGGASLLAGKALIGCMNRGGLAGTTFEMDDTFTAFTAARMAQMGLEGAKLMFRLEPQEYASGRTITSCARAIDDCLDHRLTVFLEALVVRYDAGKYVVDNSVEAQVKVCGVASGLGKSSWRTWLKLPYSVDLPRVAQATTCPILLLGGPAAGDPACILGEFAQGMAAGGNVRGALIGRNVLYPGQDDPTEIVRQLWTMVHA